MAQHRQAWLWVSLASAVLAGSFAFTYWVLMQEAARLPQADLGSTPAGRSLAAVPRPRKEHTGASLPPVRQVDRLRSDATLVRRIYYRGCGDAVVTSEHLPVALAGMERDQVARAEPGTVVEDLSPSKLTLVQTRSGNCPGHSGRRYLGVAGENLALFRGLPGSPEAKPVEVFDLPAQSLPEREVQDLRRGIPVGDDNELKRMLQSYLELGG